MVSMVSSERKGEHTLRVGIGIGIGTRVHATRGLDTGGVWTQSEDKYKKKVVWGTKGGPYLAGPGEVGTRGTAAGGPAAGGRGSAEGRLVVGETERGLPKGSGLDTLNSYHNNCTQQQPLSIVDFYSRGIPIGMALTISGWKK